MSALTRWELPNEYSQDEAYLRLQIAQRVYDGTPIWEQYLDGSLEVHVHAKRRDVAVCVEFAPHQEFRHLEDARDAEVYAHGQDLAVLGRVVKIAKDARPLASLERLKLANDCHVFLREAFEEFRAPSREALRRVLYEELRPRLWGARVRSGEDVHEVVQGRAKVLDYLADQHPGVEFQRIDDGRAWTDRCGARVLIGEHTVYAQLLDPLNGEFQIRQVFTCPRVTPVRPSKLIHRATTP